MTSSQSSGPNPLCEVGKRHPRDRHRMRPVEGYEGVWRCVKHDLYATVLPDETVAGIDRGDPYTMHDGAPGVASRPGDERPGGVILYYRPELHS